MSAGNRRGWRLIAAVALAAGSIAGTSAATAQAGPLVYVALGDSFTSGPLVLPHDTTWVPEDCGQSTRNYPHQVAAILEVGELRDVSCGSAKIDHFYETQTGLPLGNSTPPQFRVLGPDVDIVTVGIGGNDVGYVGAATDCIRLVGPPVEEPCTATMDGDRIAERLPEARNKLMQALQDIAELSPNAEIFVVNYPTSLPDDAVACWPYLPILPEDMVWLVERFKDMNAMLAEVAATAGVTLVDIYTPSIGHDACKPPGIAWVNGAVIVPPSYPAHPNDLAYLNLSPVVAEAIRARLAASLDVPETASTAGSAGESDAGAAVLAETATSRAVGDTPPLPRTGGGNAHLVGAVAAALAAASRRRLHAGRPSVPPTATPTTSSAASGS